MKSSLLLLVIFITSFSFSQDSTKIRKVGTPIITSKVYLGKSIVVENFKIEFIEVIQDSRCPKGVNCVWAGEVLIFVDLYKDGKKEKEIIVEEGSSEISMSTLIVDEGGQFNQTSLSNALKKSCDKLITKLLQ